MSLRLRMRGRKTLDADIPNGTKAWGNVAVKEVPESYVESENQQG